MRGRLHRRAMRIGRAAVIAAMLSAIAPAPAHADVWCWLFGTGCGGGSATSESEQTAAPEVDPNTIANAIALLGGGAAILADRFRRR